jgi:hypothetical protein
VIGDKVRVPSGATGVVRDEQNGKAFVKIDGSGNTGWFDQGGLTPQAAKSWPPETETK